MNRYNSEHFACIGFLGAYFFQGLLVNLFAGVRKNTNEKNEMKSIMYRHKFGSFYTVKGSRWYMLLTS